MTNECANTGTTTQNNPVRWFEIYVQDMDRARAFYEAVFEVKLEKLQTPDVEIWAFPMVMDKAGCGGALVKAKVCPSGWNSVLVYFASADCSIELSRIVKAGRKIAKEKMSIGQYGFIGHGIDTEGNVFGVHSME
jgi:hypothetical protein